VKQCSIVPISSRNLFVCPKCNHHNRVSARERLHFLLDPEGRYEIGTDIIPVDSLKFRDSRRYTERLEEGPRRDPAKTTPLIVMQGSIETVPVVAAAFEFKFLGGSMGSVVGERFVRGCPIVL